MRACALCKETARAFCESDQASLCWSCDAKVHGANFLVARHSRTLLCHACQSLTPWKASGPKLGGRTVSFCDSCLRRRDSDEGGGDNEDHEDGDDDDGDEEERTEGDGDESGGGEMEEGGDGTDEGDNQVVPWSSSFSSTTPPPPASCSSSEDDDLAGSGSFYCGAEAEEVDEVGMYLPMLKKTTIKDSVGHLSQISGTTDPTTVIKEGKEESFSGNHRLLPVLESVEVPEDRIWRRSPNPNVSRLDAEFVTVNAGSRAIKRNSRIVQSHQPRPPPFT